MADLFDIIRFLFVAAVLISACIGDWKKREVSDLHWIVLGAFGVASMAYMAFDAGPKWEYAMMIAGSAMILISILFDIERSKVSAAVFYSLLGSMFIIPVCLSYGDQVVQQFSTVPVVYLISILLFASGAIKGGADVKCLITLALVFQTYPEFCGSPMIAAPSFELSLVFPFAMMILFHAALFSLSLSVYFIVRNIGRKDMAFPQMLMGYRMDTEDVAGSFVWPLEYADGGKIVVTGKAQDADVLEGLKNAGAERIWVTLMIPFLIPMAVSFFFVTLIGNLLFIRF